MKIHIKIAKLLEAVPKMKKDKTNPFFKSQYFDINQILEAIKPFLEAQKLSVMQPLSHIEGKPAIKTIIVDNETGETYEEITPITDNLDPQKQGSSITYFRRYALQSMLSLEAEDDDANKGVPAKKTYAKSDPVIDAQTRKETAQAVSELPF
jgi:hypothetical protein